MTKDEALKLALVALENIYDGFKTSPRAQYTAITAIQEALAQTSDSVEQEPLEYWNAVEGWVKIDEVRQHFETVSCGTIYKTAGEGRVPLYTAPPKREWVSLTDGKIDAITNVQWGGMSSQPLAAHRAYARAIEDKLREVNT